MVCLIKPQFEAGREKVGKKGVVRDSRIRCEVMAKIVDYADMIGFTVSGLDYSPVRGPEGNIEYLLYLHKDKTEEEIAGLSEREAEAALEVLRAEAGGLSCTPGWKALIAKVAEESVRGTE